MPSVAWAWDVGTAYRRFLPKEMQGGGPPKRGWVWKRNGFDLEVRNILWNLGKIYL